MTSMRILVNCAAGIVSGKEIMSLHLLRELKNRGHEVHCIMASWGSDDFRERLQALDVPFENLRMGFISKTLTWSAIRMTLVQAIYLPYLWLKYYKCIRRIRPDVIVHTNFHHLFLLYPFLHLTNNIYWSHEVVGESKFYAALFRWYERRMLAFVAVSKAVENSLLRCIRHKPVYVITNGITKPESFIRRSQTSGPVVLAIAGQVSFNKGHHVLIEALSELPHEMFVLHIFGTGSTEYVSGLQNTIRELNLAENCRWEGFVKETSRIYEGVDIVIVPSVFPDPYPTTIMEAGVRGIVVVGSTSGGIPEMIEPGVNGYLFVSGDVVSLRNVLCELIESRNYIDISERARIFAEAKFGIPTFANKFERLIQEVITDA